MTATRSAVYHCAVAFCGWQSRCRSNKCKNTSNAVQLQVLSRMLSKVQLAHRLKAIVVLQELQLGGIS